MSQRDIQQTYLFPWRDGVGGRKNMFSLFSGDSMWPGRFRKGVGSNFNSNDSFMVDMMYVHIVNISQLLGGSRGEQPT